jgi:hypothetical protein
MTDTSASKPATLDSTPGPYDPEMKEAGQLTSPTWELELFLSGAFVFATFQLPGLIERLNARLAPHVTETSEFLLFNGVMYGKAIAFTLIAMFSVHLFMRAYWVALMGIHSVFPKGIRWDELKAGPVTRAIYRERVRPASDAIARLDNGCSIVFSAGLLIVLLFLLTTCVVAAATAIGYGIAHTIGDGTGTETYFLGVLVVFMLVPLVARLIEKRAGDDIDPASRTYRLLRRLIGLSYTLSGMRWLGPMMLTLTTNVGRRRALALLGVTLVGLIFVAMIDRLSRTDRLSINSYDYFGASRNHGVDYRFYESERDSEQPYSRVPSIQSDIVRDPYLKLFVPYDPRRDNAVIARVCPTVRPLQPRGLQLGADSYLPDSSTVPVLECIGRIHAVKLVWKQPYVIPFWR